MRSMRNPTPKWELAGAELMPVRRYSTLFGLHSIPNQQRSWRSMSFSTSKFISNLALKLCVCIQPGSG